MHIDFWYIKENKILEKTIENSTFLKNTTSPVVAVKKKKET